MMRNKLLTVLLMACAMLLFTSAAYAQIEPPVVKKCEVKSDCKPDSNVDGLYCNGEMDCIGGECTKFDYTEGGNPENPCDNQSNNTDCIEDPGQIPPYQCVDLCETDADCANDSLLCNGVSTCEAGFCTVPEEVVCEPGQVCSEGDGGICVDIPDCTEDADCDDGVYCNGEETCVEGSCAAGTPPVCDDGSYCNGVEICGGSDTCEAGTPIDCDDGVYCNGEEICNDDTDTCDAGTPVDCGEGNRCNEGLDTCEEIPACEIDGDCGDGNECTEDTCDNGTCVNDPIQCTFVCDPELGCVECLDTEDCGEEEICESGVCFPTIGVECETDEECIDDVYCDGEERCVDNVCVEAEEVPCEDSDLVCDEALDECVECLSDEDCTDNATPFCKESECVECTLDEQCESTDPCLPEAACVDDACVFSGNPCADFGEICENIPEVPAGPAAAIGESCNVDGDCVASDLCQVASCSSEGSLCVEEAKDCGDDLCDLADGDCVECLDNGDCAFGTCESNACVAGECNDDAQCEVGETCNSNGVCTGGPGAPCTEDADCIDDVYCDGEESCVDGFCVEGTFPCEGEDVCDEINDVCGECLSDDECDDDGLYCTGEPVCEIVEGASVCGEAGDPCEADEFCDEDNATCLTSKPCEEDADCIDDVYCDGEEFCDESLGDQYNDAYCAKGTPPCEEGEVCDEEREGCFDYICVPCVSDDQCDDGDFCNGIETCVDGECTDGDECPVLCDEDEDECYECEEDADCDFDNDTLCNTDTRLCVECLGDDNCTDLAAPFCDEEGVCQECVDDDDCPTDGEPCNGEEICVLNECTNSGNPCTDKGLACRPDEEDNDTAFCFECDNDTECNDFLWCTGDETCENIDGDNVCVSSGQDCAELCNDTADMCVQCLTQSDCDDDGDDCNGDEICRSGQCISDGDGPCAPGEICVDGGDCVDCSADTDCPRDEYCVSGACVGCVDDMDCGPYQECDDGLCSDIDTSCSLKVSPKKYRAGKNLKQGFAIFRVKPAAKGQTFPATIGVVDFGPAWDVLRYSTNSKRKQLKVYVVPTGQIARGPVRVIVDDCEGQFIVK